jgi:putative SOS response-associated peptidase YedK
MCYEIKVSLERQLKVARKFGDKIAIDELESKLLPLLNPIEREYYRISGFEHPKLLLFDGKSMLLAQWGLVPHWTRTEEEMRSIRNRTLNARLEEIESKPSFREAFRSRRAVLFVDGFYEHQHKFGKTFPHFIAASNQDYLAMACIFEFPGPFSSTQASFSIVTKTATGIMKEIHNNPKLSEPRMPLLLKNENVQNWINPEIPIPDYVAGDIDLIAHTVRRTTGSEKHNQSILSSEPFNYPEFQKGLFED